MTQEPQWKLDVFPAHFLQLPCRCRQCKVFPMWEVGGCTLPFYTVKQVKQEGPMESPRSLPSACSTAECQTM